MDDPAPALQVRMEGNGRVTLFVTLDLREQHVADFYSGTVWLQLFSRENLVILRTRVVGFSEWLEAIDPLQSDEDPLAAIGQQMLDTGRAPIDIVLRDTHTGKMRGRRTVLVTIEFLKALSLATHVISSTMVEIAISRPAYG